MCQVKTTNRPEPESRGQPFPPSLGSLSYAFALLLANYYSLMKALP